MLNLPEADILLHAGDLTVSGSLSQYQSIYQFLKSHPVKLKIVIAGNHDFTLDSDYKTDPDARQWNPSLAGDEPAVRELWTSQEARDAGIIYCQDGTQTFSVDLKDRGTAKFTVFTSPRTPAFEGFAFPYPVDVDIFGPGKRCFIPDHPQVDIVLTHGPPRGHLDTTVHDMDVGCPHLLKALKRSRPRLMVCGHIHEGAGAEAITWSDEVDGDEKAIALEPDELPIELNQDGVDLKNTPGIVHLDMTGDKELEFGKQTLLVNAAVMKINYRFKQNLWLVDLNLPSV
jgi:hypothetical protein